MKQIALSIEQMNHLQGLGVDTSSASMCWIYSSIEHYILGQEKGEVLCINNGECKVDHPAFTIQDILELLPNFISKDGYMYDLASDMHNSMAYKIDWDNLEDDSLMDVDGLYLHTASDGSNLLKMAFKMLCWVAENGYLKNKEV